MCNKFFSTLCCIIVILLSILCNCSFSDENKQLETAVIQYLNSIHSIQASFTQSSEFEESQGIFLLKKPGKLKLHYQHPNNVLILLNRNKITYYDFALKEYTKMFNKNPVLATLTADKFTFNAFESHNITTNDNYIYLNVTVKDEENNNIIFDLLFTHDPIQLIGFSYLDFQNNLININLLSVHYNTTIADKEFEFANPRFIGTHR